MRATVAVAISAPEAVDIIAATAAANARPLMPTGRIVSASWAYTSSLASTSGRNVDAAIPITAPATPYSRQYTAAVVPPHLATPGERAVNTRCQMSCPISIPKL